MKLIRDKIALTPAPNNRTVLVVSEDTQRALILDKLMEEASEVWQSKSQQEMTQELADVYEVLERLQRLHKISREDVAAAGRRKFESNGGFEQGYVLL